MSNQIPETIRTIIAQCGGLRNLNSAFCYVGADQFIYKCAQMEGEYRSGYESHINPQGQVDHEVGLTFRVNGKRGEGWRIIIAYEPNDTYTVYLWRVAHHGERKRGLLGAVISQIDEVYGEDLQHIIEKTYDRAIKERNGGFIPC